MLRPPYAEVMILTRSPRFAALVLVGCLGAASACGSDDTSTDSTTPLADNTGASAPPPADAEAAFPVSIEHKYGTTTIEAEPTRVVALGPTDQDPLLALGVVPVAVVDWRGAAVHPWNEELFTGASPVGIEDPATSVDFEAIAATEPDLIVSLWSGITEDDYVTLSEIAPTIAQSGDHPDFGAPWDVNTRVVGLATGRSTEAEALIADVEAAIDATRAAHPELEGQSITVASDFADGNVYITPPDDARYDLLEGLGMETAPAALDGVDTLSFEQVDQLNALDVVFWITIPGATIDTDPVYTAQSIHTEGRDIFPTDESELSLALTFGTVLSIPYTLDHLTPLLATAVDGDPATN